MKKLSKPERKELRILRKKHDISCMTFDQANRLKFLEMKRVKIK